MASKIVSSTELKAHLDEIIDSVTASGETVTVTRDGKQVAEIAPISAPEAPREGKKDLFGAAKGWITIHGDIMEPIDEVWEADG